VRLMIDHDMVLAKQEKRLAHSQSE